MPRSGGRGLCRSRLRPDPDINPSHDWQVVLIDHAGWARFLDPTADIADLLRLAPRGTLRAKQVS